MAEWTALLDVLKESDWQLADLLAGKLRQIRCTLGAPLDQEMQPVTFSDDEVKDLARLEHGR